MPWTVMCIPGRDDDDSDPGAWFAYNRETRQSVRAADRHEARRLARALNLNGKG